MKYPILDDIGRHFINRAAELVRTGCKFVFVLDNIDWEEKASKEMSTKSEALTMPVLMKDEKKYSDCVDVLDQLEHWTQEIYSAAGLCSSKLESSDETIPPIGTTSRPDQPASHVLPARSESDPLRGVKIPCFGDQLTRVRFAGAKDLRAGCHSAKQRLDHLYPFCIVDWHTKRSFLKVILSHRHWYMLYLYIADHF